MPDLNGDGDGRDATLHFQQTPFVEKIFRANKPIYLLFSAQMYATHKLICSVLGFPFAGFFFIVMSYGREKKLDMLYDLGKCVLGWN